MPISLTRQDGIHILSKATLQQLMEDETLRVFASGLIPQALAAANLAEAKLTLAEALQNVDLFAVNAFLTTLLVLDAEVQAVVDDETRTWPLPGFLSYRARLPADKFPLNTLRLPPLNPAGHYRFTEIEAGCYLAVRMDIHPELRVMGHVRLALFRPQHIPQRLRHAEHRLDRQILDEEIIDAAIAAVNEDLIEPLNKMERAKLVEVLRGF